jgi:TonB family protein
MLDRRSSDWGESDFASLLRSPFLVSSLLFHGLLFFAALRAATLTIPKPETNTPISVQLMEVRSGADTKSIGPGQGAGGPRELPKLGVPIAPAERTGKLDSGSVETSVPAPPANIEAAPAPKPIALPGPKVLAMDSRQEVVNAKETSADSLVRLPTKESATNLPSNSAADLDAHQKSLAAIKSGAEGAGIKALKEGPQVPGALKGSGANPGPYGVAGGSRSGTGLAGGGSGIGSGGGSKTGLKGTSSADWDDYVARLRKRVESVWKYPDGVTGEYKFAFVFTLDRAGRLTHVEVAESSNARLNASAMEAMRRASPFAPLPESLKDLANEPLRIIFTVTIRVRG